MTAMGKPLGKANSPGRPKRNRLPGTPTSKPKPEIPDEQPIPEDEKTPMTIEAQFGEIEVGDISVLENGEVVSDLGRADGKEESTYKPPVRSWGDTPISRFLDRVAAGLEKIGWRTLRRSAIELIWVPQGKTYPVEPYVPPGGEIDPSTAFIDYGRNCGLRVLRVKESSPGYQDVARAVLPTIRVDMDQVRINSDECAWLGVPNLNCNMPVGTGSGAQMMLTCTQGELIDPNMAKSVVDFVAKDDPSVKIKHGEFTEAAWKEVCESLDMVAIRRIYSR